jgi:hypothetical protein
MDIRNNFFIININLINSVVLVGSVLLSQNGLSKLNKFWWCTSLSASDQSIYFFVNFYIVSSKITNKFIFGYVSRYVVFNALGHFNLTLICGWISNANIVLGCSSVVINIKCVNRSRWILFFSIKRAYFFLDLSKFSSLRVLYDVVF